MASPDRRLFELVTLLTDVGADWLALEILDAVRGGLPSEESGNALRTAQIAARFGFQPEIAKERMQSFPAVEELTGARQLAWAAAYVVERLADEAEMLNASLQQLSGIAIGSEDGQKSRIKQGRESAIIALQVGEDGPVAETFEITDLRKQLELLKAALEKWTAASDRAEP